jgi:hypothetical protein
MGQVQERSNSETSWSSDWQDHCGTVSPAVIQTPQSGFQARELYKEITTTVMSQTPF